MKLVKEINSKVLTNYRRSHIINILESFDKEHLGYGKNVPIDLHIRKYFLSNKTVSNIDREFINSQICNLIRYKTLLDFIVKQPVTWNTRLDYYISKYFEQQLENVNLPPHIRVSFNKELYDLISNSFGKKTYDICKILNERAPLTIRTNLLKCSREDLYKMLRNKGFDVEMTKYSPYGISFKSLRANLFAMDEFRKGMFEVQDEASQLVSLRVDCKPGDIVLDYCGGSAGKTLALAPFTQGRGQIFIHDIRKHILLEARKRLRRAGVQNYQLNPDKENLHKLLKNKCDWILLDVPCSGTGTIRRNPDLKIKFSTERLEELLNVQEKILEESLDLLKSNGRIVYVTCSLLKEENINQIMKFCRKFGVKIENDTIFQTEPKSGMMDGFFSVTLKL